MSGTNSVAFLPTIFKAGDETRAFIEQEELDNSFKGFDFQVNGTSADCIREVRGELPNGTQVYLNLPDQHLDGGSVQIAGKTWEFTPTDVKAPPGRILFIGDGGFPWVVVDDSDPSHPIVARVSRPNHDDPERLFVNVLKLEKSLDLSHELPLKMSENLASEILESTWSAKINLKEYQVVNKGQILAERKLDLFKTPNLPVAASEYKLYEAHYRADGCSRPRLAQP